MTHYMEVLGSGEGAVFYLGGDFEWNFDSKPAEKKRMEYLQYKLLGQRGEGNHQLLNPLFVAILYCCGI